MTFPPSVPVRPRRGRLAAAALTLVAVAAGLAALVAPVGPASASLGSPNFAAGAPYDGEFGSPTIEIVGNTYWAFGTATGGVSVPAIHSTDLVHWRARDAWPESAAFSTWRGYDETLVRPAGYSATGFRNGHRTYSVWAPSVAPTRSGWVMAYVLNPRGMGDKRCISIATAPRVDGPYRDDSTRPIVCSSDPLGSIDPQVFQPGNGRSYLVWKNAGVPGSTPTRIWVRQLAPGGTAFQPGTRAHELLQTERPWEGNVVEAPAMIHVRNRYYLFYSGNRYLTSSYATGYAICAGPLGPCHRGQSGPLLATGGSVAGPGAGTPFVDLAGRLRFAYSAWRIGHVGYPTSTACESTRAGCNQRRLHVATLSIDARGRIHVVDRG